MPHGRVETTPVSCRRRGRAVDVEPLPGRADSSADWLASACVTQQKRAALQKCQKALGVQTLGAIAASRIAVTCADLYSEKACREAFRNAPKLPPEKLAASLALACRAAYCPKLSPRPKACDGEWTTPSELMSGWAQLSRSILAHEFCLKEEAVPHPMSLPPTQVLGPVPAGIVPPAPTVALRFCGERVCFFLGERKWSALAAGQMAKELRRQFPTGDAVTVVAAEGVDWGKVVLAMDALRQVGFRNVAFSLAAKQAK